ncbi:hypothetical protein SISSUDRAFT_1062185 [Sistotremastrum suecicum HHB10207 ss-3]|uniref:Uncharacterized protein n=1 Tax=Sistotremastrum suecicum HHB10207 ss-3 TaxID=1314776 RepID=A0A166D5M7_9AGAM|nr:hypothetical protein SISSUDRAFT_1062185 [Sistotremastrum suecicum HHB10207 ss-3]
MSECKTSLDGYQMVGLTLTSEAALFSMIAVTGTLSYIGIKVVNAWRRRRRPWRLFKRPLDVYVFSLLSSDLVQSLGGVMSLKWVHEQSVTCSSYCSGQGIMQNMGETGSAMATIAIAIHTFLVIVFRWRIERLWFPILVVSAIWIFCILFPIINWARFRKDQEPFLFPSPYCSSWCWIGARSGLQIGGEYVWLWIAALVSILLYVPLFFVIRGNLDIDEDRWWKLRFTRDADQADSALSFQMLLYPMAYSVLVIPLSVCRWFQFSHHEISTAARFGPFTLFSLMGLVNVILLRLLRPDVLMMGREENRLEEEHEL